MIFLDTQHRLLIFIFLFKIYFKPVDVQPEPYCPHRENIFCVFEPSPIFCYYFWETLNYNFLNFEPQLRRFDIFFNITVSFSYLKLGQLSKPIANWLVSVLVYLSFSLVLFFESYFLFDYFRVLLFFFMVSTLEWRGWL